MMQLAENPRTATKAWIKRASAQARARMNRLDAETLQQLENLYREARADLHRIIISYANHDPTLRLSVMQSMVSQIEARLDQLGKARQFVLEEGLMQAAIVGAQPFEAILPPGGITRIAEEAVRFTLVQQAADGMQLSDRLWRIDDDARQLVSRSIRSAIVQGHSASQAAQDFLERGVKVPAELQAKIAGANGVRVARVAGEALMTGEMNPYAQARRVFRTEINRAHGEAYQAAAFEHPDTIGTRFLLSRNHPKVDICDMHSRVNLYGLGPGVYPKGRNPWPAHPNTLSYVEVVFADEVSDSDRAGKIDRLSWLQGQPLKVQLGVLGSRRKTAALQKGLLRQNEIATPWKRLKSIYERRGIDVDSLVLPPTPSQKLGGTVLIGGGDSLRTYIEEAFSGAPASVIEMNRSVRPLSSVTLGLHDESHYNRVHRSMHLHPRHILITAGAHSKYDVYRHEFGHHVDYYGAARGQSPRQLSMMSRGAGGLRDAIEDAKKSLYAYGKAGKDRHVRLRLEMIEFDDLSVADLFGSLTRNRIGWGHSEKYLAYPGNAETEIFANLYDIFSRPDRTAWRFVEAELPGLAAEFEQVIERWS